MTSSAHAGRSGRRSRDLGRRVPDLRLRHVEWILALEGECRRDEPEKYDAHRIQIGAQIHRMAQYLFGRHVGRRAEHLADIRQVDRTLEPRDPEVHDLDRPALRDHEIAWLQIPVHHACRVRVGKRRERLHAELRGAPGRKHADLVQDVLERLAADQLHDHHQPLVVFQQLVDRGDSRMAEPGKRGGLSTKAGCRVCDGRVENLEGDVAPERLVDCPVHAAHSTVSEPFDDEVLTDSFAWSSRFVHQLYRRGSLAPALSGKPLMTEEFWVYLSAWYLKSRKRTSPSPAA